MPRSADYYQKQQAKQQSLPVQQAPTYQSPLLVNNPAPAPQYRDPNDERTARAIDRGFWSFFGQGLREVVTGSQPEWDEMSFGEKSGAVAKGTGKIGVDMVTSLPKVIVKAPVGVGLTILEGVDTASQKVLGTKQFVPNEVDLTGIFGDNKVSRYFGTVSGVKQTYNEAKALGDGSGFDNFLAAVSATGKVSGDLAISYSTASSIKSAFQPSLKQVSKPVTGKDFRPQTPTMVSQIKTKIGEVTGGKMFENPVIRFQQDPNAAWFNLSKGGQASKTWVRISPAGNGMAKATVYEQRPSLVSRIGNKLGISKKNPGIIQTEAGTMAETGTAMIEYNPGVIAQAGDAMPAWLENAGPAVQPVAGLPAAASPTMAAGAVQPASASSALQLGPTESLVIDAALPEGYTRVADTAYKSAVENGGVTINLQGNQPSEGYAYSPFKDSEAVVPKEQFTPEHVQGFISKNFDRLQQPGNHVGIWEDNGQIYLDVSQVGAPGPETLSAAEAAGQLAVFDLQKFETINTKLYGQEANRSNLSGGQDSGAAAAGSDAGNGQVSEFLQPAAGGTQPAATVSPKLQQAQASGAKELGIQVPRAMQRPLPGFADEPVNATQLGEINYVAQQRNIDDVALNVITNLVTGKQSIADLTQAEAFDVAETIRLFNQPLEPGQAADLQGLDYARPFIHPARYRFESVERNLKYPIYSQGYIPIETGFRMSDRVLFPQMNEYLVTKIFGEFSDPKFSAERSLIDAYSTGNKAAILENKTLTPEMKTKLAAVGDKLIDWYRLLREKGGISSARFEGQYAPELEDTGTISNIYKTDDLPGELRPFFTFERKGSDRLLLTDALQKAQIYAKQYARNKFLREPMQNAVEMAKNLPPNVKKDFNSYLQEKLGRQGEMERTLNTWGEKLSRKTNGALPPDIFRKTINFLMTSSYAATLGLPRLVPVMAQGIQLMLMNYAEYGGDIRNFVQGFKKALSGDTTAADKGFMVDQPVQYGADMATSAEATNASGLLGKATNLVGRALGKYEDFSRMLLKPNAVSDNFNRKVTVAQERGRFEKFWNQYLDGKISYDEFEKGINMEGFNPTLQKIIREKLIQNTDKSLGEAMDLMVQDRLDTLHFPYRKGSETRMHYGLKGKLGLQYTQWPWEYAHTFRSWFARKQWSNLLRWYAMATIIERTADEALGVDVKTYTNLVGPFKNAPVGPLANAVIATVKAGFAATADMTEEFENNRKEIADSLINYLGPAFGVASQRLQHFKMSLDRTENGLAVSTDPDPLKRYGIYSTTGKLKQWVNFADLLKYTFGFKLSETEDFSSRTKQIQKDTIRYNEKVNEAMNALVDGDYKKFDKIVTENNIVIGDINQKLQSYQVPLDQRLWQRMPAPLKEKYVDILFPNQ